MDFSEYLQNVNSGVNSEPTGTSFMDLLSAPSTPEPSTDSDIVDMLVEANTQVAQDFTTFGDKAALKELSALNKNFTDYADNIVKLQNKLNTVLNSEEGANVQDVQDLSELLSVNRNIVSAINTHRQQDSDFNNDLEEYERRTGFEMRSSGITEQSQDDITAKRGITSKELWDNIGSNLGQYTETIKDDAKTGLIEGLGGPVGVLARKVVLPGINAAREFDIGGKLRGVRDMFKSSTEDETEVAASDNDISDLEDADAGIVEPVNGIQANVATLAQDITVPDQSDIKKRLVREERVKRQLKDKNSGILSDLVDLGSEGVGLLGSILDQLKSDKDTLDDMYTTLAEATLVQESIADITDAELTDLNATEEDTSRVLSSIDKTQALQERKNDVINEFNKDTEARQEEQDEETEVIREEDLNVQHDILDELKHLDVEGGGGSGMIGNLLTSLLGGGAAAGGGASGMMKMGAKGGLYGAFIAASMYGIAKLDESMEKHRTGTGTIDWEEFYGYQKERIFGRSEDKMEVDAALSQSKTVLSDDINSIGEIEDESARAEATQKANLDFLQANSNIETEDKSVSVETISAEEKASSTDLSSLDVSSMSRDELSDVVHENKGSGIIYKDKYYDNASSTMEITDSIRETQSAEAADVEVSTESAAVDATVGAAETMQALPESDTTLDSDIASVTKESAELKAETETLQTSESNQTASVPTGGGSRGGAGGQRKQNLDNISTLPEDNFGLVLVNSGTNIS